MAANEALNALSTTDATNSPDGTDTVGTTVDDELRSIKANIARAARYEYETTRSAATTFAVTVMHKSLPLDGAAGGATTFTLPLAATAANGFHFHVFKSGTTNPVIIDGGASTIDGAADLTLSAQFSGAILVCDGTNWGTIRDTRTAGMIEFDSSAATSLSASTVQAALVELDARTVEPRINYGAVLSNSGNQDISITAGAAWDTTHATWMELSAIIKQIDASWAVGTNAGGMDTGAVAADSTYYVWMINRSDTGVTDAMFSLSSTVSGLTFPAGGAYDTAQLIGAVSTDSGGTPAIYSFVQYGDEFLYTNAAAIQCFSQTITTSLTFEATDQSLVGVPGNSLAHITLHLTNSGETSVLQQIAVRPAGSSRTTVTETAALYLRENAAADPMDEMAVILRYPVNADAELSVTGRKTAGTLTIDCYAHGFNLLERFGAS